MVMAGPKNFGALPVNKSNCIFMRAKYSRTMILKPYAEGIWAEATDYQLPITYSLDLLKGLHQRWTHLLTNLSEDDLNRTYLHPEGNVSYTLLMAFDTYQWHCRHHLAHVQQAKVHQFSE